MFQSGASRVPGVGFVINDIRAKFTLVVALHHNLLKVRTWGALLGIVVGDVQPGS